MAEVQPIPENDPRVTPSLPVDGAADAIEFYTDGPRGSWEGKVRMAEDFDEIPPELERAFSGQSE